MRNANYINADMRDVARGGLVFNDAATRGSIILMGDSNGSMYGRMARQIADELDLKLIVISAAAEDPLPRSSGQDAALWKDSLAVVKQARPNYLLLACNWEAKLKDDKDRLGIAVNELKKHTDHLILITQPPELPDSANRESIRNGSRPPFFEDPEERSARTQANAIVKSFSSNNVTVIDINSHFESQDGRILFADSSGNQYFHDSDHLSGNGANLVKADVLKAITDIESGHLKEAHLP